MQRRDFLKLTGRSTLFLAFAGCANTKNLRALGDLPRPKSKVSELNLEGAFPVSSGQLLFPSFDNPRSVLGKEYPDTGNSFFNLSFSKRKLQGISTPLKLSHAAFQFPTEHHRVIILEKDGGLACTINLREMQVEKIVPAKKDWNFNGHGVFSADQKYFYTTEYWKSEKNIGAIVVRDGRTFEILGEMNSGGIQPHDLKFFDSEKKMAVAHYGKTPGNTRANLGASITFLEIVSGKVLQTVDAPGGNQELCHISISNEGNYIVSTQDFVNLPALANGSVKPSDLKLRQQHYPAPIIVGKFGEAPKVFQPTHLENHFQFNFSIAHDFERGIAAIAHINGKYVSFWNVRESRFLKGHALEDMVAGMELSADKSIFIASAPSTLYFFSASTFKKIGAVKLPTVASAPHILMLPEQV